MTVGKQELENLSDHYAENDNGAARLIIAVLLGRNNAAGEMLE